MPEGARKRSKRGLGANEPQAAPDDDPQAAPDDDVPGSSDDDPQAASGDDDPQATLDDDAPRLPPAARRVRHEPAWQATAFAQRRPDPALAVNAVLSTDKYVEPTLTDTHVGNQLVIATRLLAFVWAGALAVAAVITRSRAADGGEDGSLVTFVGRMGIGVVVLLLVIGWWWSDRGIRNIRLLDGRRPTRFRGGVAWLAPGLWAGLLAFTIVQLEPNDLFDYRPPIIVFFLALAAWRPYALIRRMLMTLTRVRSDALIGSAFVLDLAGFGLLWWQLTTWPSTIDRAGGSAETMIGVAVAASVAFGANFLVWRMLLTDTEVANAYRLTQLGTRHDHKILRLRGIDPSDPAVWWELVQRHLERQPAPPEPVAGAAPLEQSQPTGSGLSVGELLAQIRADNRGSLRRLGNEGSTAVLAQVRSRFSSDLDAPSTDWAADDGKLRERFATALGTSRLSEQQPERIPQISLRRRLGLEDGGSANEADETLHRFFISAGRAEVDAAVAQMSSDELSGHAERTEPPRLYRLEAARFLLLGASAALVVTALWLVSRTPDGSVLDEAGRLQADAVDSLNLARRAMVTALTLMLAVVPLWAATVASHARRTGAIITGGRQCVVAFAGLSVLAGLSIALDGDTRGTTTLLLLVPATAVSVWCALTVIAVQRWFDLPSRSLLAWAIGAPTLLCITWIGRLQRPIVPTDSLPGLTFFTVLVTVLASLLIVVLSTTATEIEDAIRVSPELATPVAARSGRTAPPSTSEA